MHRRTVLALVGAAGLLTGPPIVILAAMLQWVGTGAVLGYALAVAGLILLVAHRVLRVAIDVGRIYHLGYDDGYRRGHRDGRREGRPVLVPLDERRTG